MLKKTPVIGTVERGGKVKAKVADDLTGKGVLKFKCCANQFLIVSLLHVPSPLVNHVSQSLE